MTSTAFCSTGFLICDPEASLSSSVTRPKAQLKAYEITIAELNTKVEWYKANAVTIANRRAELGELAKDISDVDILDETKFSDAKVAQANEGIEKAAEVVGLKTASEDNYRRLQNEIRDKADGKIKRVK